MGPNHIGPFEVLYQARQFIPLTHKLWDGRKTPTWTQQYETLENVDTSTFVPFWTNGNREKTWRSSTCDHYTPNPRQKNTSVWPYQAVIITFHSSKNWRERVSLGIWCWPYWLNTMQLSQMQIQSIKRQNVNDGTLFQQLASNHLTSVSLPCSFFWLFIFGQRWRVGGLVSHEVHQFLKLLWILGTSTMVNKEPSKSYIELRVYL